MIITNESSLGEYLKLAYEGRVEKIIVYKPGDLNFEKNEKIIPAAGMDELITRMHGIKRKIKRTGDDEERCLPRILSLRHHTN